MPAKAQGKTSGKPAGASKKRTDTQHLNVAFIWDMSGSMSRVWDSAIEGANQYIYDLQQDEGAATTNFSLTIFDTVFENWYVDVPVADIPPITHERYAPRGGTALNDAIANTIAELDARLKGDRADERVLVVVLTDGHENSSQEYGNPNRSHIGPGTDRLAALVRTYEQRGWTFSWIGDGLQAQVEEMAANYNIPAGNTMAYTATEANRAESTGAAFANLSTSTLMRKYSPEQTSSELYADAGVSQDVTNVGTKDEEK